MKKLAAAFSILLLLGTSCDSTGSGGAPSPAADDPSAPIQHEQDVYSRMTLKLDPALSYKEKSLLIGDFYQSMSTSIQAKTGSYFDKSFGGTDTSALIRYLDERINYVLPQSVDLDSRISVKAQAQTYVVALNIGTALWLESVAQSPAELSMRIGDASILLNDTRVGIIQLGEGYTAKRSNGQYAFPAVIRVSTLIHEARHSDCTGGISSSDVQVIRDGGLPSNHSCGHVHVKCPEGHEYAGHYACDDHAWGAYTMGALYSIGISRSCADCSAEDRRVAEATAVDSLSRLLIDAEQMATGKYGDPDMSSDARVIDDPAAAPRASNSRAPASASSIRAAFKAFRAVRKTQKPVHQLILN